MSSDLLSLIALVRSRSSSVNFNLHGEAHWREVATIGLGLADETSGCDRLVVLLFALFHDAMRVDEGSDPHHGDRGAALVAELGAGMLGINAGQKELLEFACREHTRGAVSVDPTVGVCWDADRLTLGRVGITPKARYFSTVAGRARVATYVASGVREWSDLVSRLGPTRVTQ